MTAGEKYIFYNPNYGLTHFWQAFSVIIAIECFYFSSSLFDIKKENITPSNSELNPEKILKILSLSQSYLTHKGEYLGVGWLH